MERKKLSIVTICFNAEQTIRNTIENVLKYKTKDVEYIIIDGYSNDSTIKIINEYKHSIDKIISEKDSGLYDAMNKGVINSSGEYVAFLNADDWYEKEFINNCILAIKTNTGDIYYGDVIVPKAKANKLYISQQPSLTKLYFKGMSIFHPSMCVKRKLLLKHPFDTTFNIISDYGLIVELCQKKYTFVKVNKMITYFSEGGVSSSFKKRISEGIRIRKKLGVPNIIIIISTLIRVSITLATKFKKIVWRS
tara:strand:- start:8209 stop:8958 length:750 start_codon:yes stop_codon:yes gene_type:complete